MGARLRRFKAVSGHSPIDCRSWAKTSTERPRQLTRKDNALGPIRQDPHPRCTQTESVHKSIVAA